MTMMMMMMIIRGNENSWIAFYNDPIFSKSQ